MSAPIIVLDLAEFPFTATPDQIATSLRKGGVAADWVAEQIEEQTKPPKPVEPTGLGAVVEDAEGRRWTRARSHDHGLNWREEWGGRWTTFAELDAVRVLSEGVSA